MNQKQAFKQMVDFNRGLFEKSFSAMVIWQDQVERATRVLREQASWVPNETQAVVDEWMNAYKKGRDEFRKNIVDSFEKATDYIGK